MRRKLWMLLVTAVLFVGMLGTTTALAADASGSFSADGVEISINGEAATVLSGLGKAENYYEAENCSYQGKEKVYVYKNFEISTYPVDQTDCINSIYFKTGDVATEEGISIGSTVAEMQEIYGTDYTESKGVYRYDYKGFDLTFYSSRENVINGIEYTSDK